MYYRYSPFLAKVVKLAFRYACCGHSNTNTKQFYSQSSQQYLSSMYSNIVYQYIRFHVLPVHGGENKALFSYRNFFTSIICKYHKLIIIINTPK